MSRPGTRDHGGGLDAARARFGGDRQDWLDLSTGINPVPYVTPELCGNIWTSLPDKDAKTALETSARKFWNVPTDAAILAAPGASSLIARIPALLPPGRVVIAEPTYNEHRAAFAQFGWTDAGPTKARVLVHPNNPDGRIWSIAEATRDDPEMMVIDESFADVLPDTSLIELATRPGTLILKSFGKFWGLAGLRLGFAIGDPILIRKIADALGPWPVSGPALAIGKIALSDLEWAAKTRARLTTDAQRLDDLITNVGGWVAGGTTLFRLYQVDNAATWQTRLARAQIWTRIFPYAKSWLRLGLPHPDRWAQLEAAL